MPTSLADLPVELIFDIQGFAASEAFVLTCRHTYEIFRQSPTHFRASYLQNRALDFSECNPSYRPRCCLSYSHILRYPLCTQEVLTFILCAPSIHLLQDVTGSSFKPDLPKRLFRTPPGNTRDNDLLRFLRYLFDTQAAPFPSPNVNSYKGYALTRAVQSDSQPLVRFLLTHGAIPDLVESLAVRVAIKKKDLTMTKLLIEANPRPSQSNKNKKRKVQDRVEVSPGLLKEAVKAKAWDIVDYFMKEKSCVPDMQTLQLMM